jgi:hypothetical protein
MRLPVHRTVVAFAGAAAALTLCATAAKAGTYRVSFTNGAGCGMFTASATPGYNRLVCGGQSLILTGGSAGDPAAGSEENISTTTPPGISITGATTDFQESRVGTAGWGSGDFYTGGGSSWTPGAGTSPFTDNGIDTDEWGFQLACSSGGCTQGDPAEVTVNTIAFTASESQSPTLTPDPNTLFDQTGYVWNPPGDPWPITLSGTDPSGVCGIDAVFNGNASVIESQSQNANAWQQCANGRWVAYVDTRQYVGTSGPLPFGLLGSDAAGNTTSLTTTVQVDNDPVSVSLATPDDANPTVWVNHAVSVVATPSAGPSGVAGTNCSTDGGASFADGSGGFVVNGDGIHTVSCTAANNAIGPQGQSNTATTSENIKIDEQPPAVAFEPVNPSDPTQVVVDAPDDESGLAGGTITLQGPHASAATPLATTSDGSRLYANLDDQGRNGTYTLVATACDNVGNCASTSEQLHFPLRLSSDSVLSFDKIQAPTVTAQTLVRVGYRVRTVRRRLRVDYRVKTVVRRRHGKRVRVRVEVGGHEKLVRRRVKVGGHFRREQILIHANRRCGHRRVRIRPHHWRVISSCRALKVRVVSHHHGRFGHAVKVHGLITTGQGAPVAGAPVRIFTRPVERGGVYGYATQATTDAAGIWTATLRGGPSRQIRAYYPGTATVEPATGHALLTVPARIRLSISPHVLPWSKSIHITGHLAGRYVPHDGVALRLLVHYPHVRQWTPLLALRTTAHGGFHFAWSYEAGRGVATYPFKIATTATETDYPYAAGSSPAVKVTFGRRTPRRVHHSAHRRRRAHRAHRRHAHRRRTHRRRTHRRR